MNKGEQVSLYPSYFKLRVRWLLSLTRIIDWRQLIGIHSIATFLQLELSRVYIFNWFLVLIFRLSRQLNHHWHWH
ncbi:hypothetical protein A6J65_020475 [Yersinia enterocolitica]|nr:hypothetical protein A6J65_020475 [Yersinia enterocolitica]